MKDTKVDLYLCGEVHAITCTQRDGVQQIAHGGLIGNTIYSASTVIAVFLSGLGIGSYLAGRWSDRQYRRDPNASAPASD